MTRSFLPLAFFLTGALCAQTAPATTPAQDIIDALSMRPKAMDVRPSISLRVQFALNSASLAAEGKGQLDELARAFQSSELEGKRFALNGYTDATGTAEHNLKLSKDRAAAVKRYLVDRFGVAGDRLEPHGFGATHLLLPDSPSNEQNRRVEVEVVN